MSAVRDRECDKHKIVLTLLENHCDVSIVDNWHKMTALMYGCQQGLYDSSKHIISYSNQSTIDYVEPQRGDAAIHRAIDISANPKVVQLLFENNASNHIRVMCFCLCVCANIFVYFKTKKQKKMQAYVYCIYFFFCVCVK